MPRPGEPGFGSREKDSWKGFSGVNVWGWYLTADEQRAILYMPLGSPAGNYYGAERPGNNLFGNSIVAVDAITGKYQGKTGRQYVAVVATDSVSVFALPWQPKRRVRRLPRGLATTL